MEIMDTYIYFFLVHGSTANFHYKLLIIKKLIALIIFSNKIERKMGKYYLISFEISKNII